MSGFWSFVGLVQTADGGTVNVFDDIKVHLRQYLDCAESWKPDHELAMSLYDFEELLEAGIKELKAITDGHEAWQNNVFCGLEAPSLLIDQMIWDLYTGWLRSCRRLRRMLVRFENEGYDVTHAKAFRAAVKSVLDDRKGLERPTVAVRPLNEQEVACIDAMNRSCKSE